MFCKGQRKELGTEIIVMWVYQEEVGWESMD